MGNKILINLLILTGLSTYAAQAQEVMDPTSVYRLRH